MYAKRLLTCIAAALAAAPFLVAAQTIYKYIDKDGKTVFSDTPPPKDATNATQRTISGGAPAASGLPYATQMAMQRNPVTLYTSTECGTYCDQGRSLLSRRGIPFAERNAGTDPAAAEAVQKAAGSFIVPVLVVGTSALKGFDDGTWHSTLDGAGYPRTALPNQPNPRALPPPAPPKAPPKAEAADADAEPAPDAPKPQ
jgi:glutaredoxin